MNKVDDHINAKRKTINLFNQLFNNITQATQTQKKLTIIGKMRESQNHNKNQHNNNNGNNSAKKDSDS